MDVNIIMQAIGTLGFPIVAASAMFWLVNKQGQQHKEEMDALKESLNSNTIALVELRAAIKESKDE